MIVGRRYSGIDGLRAFAVLLIFWRHAAALAVIAVESKVDALAKIYYQLSILGTSGVCLFFVISGFLITGILIDTAYEKECLKKFYIRRSLRIFPLYYLALAIILVTSIIYIPTFQLDWNLLHLAIYIQNWMNFFSNDFLIFINLEYIQFNHFWSLAVEEQFYLIWPLIFLFFYKRCSPRVTTFSIISIIISSITLRYILILVFKQEWYIAYAWTLTRIDALLMGALLAYSLKKFSTISNRLDKLGEFFLPTLPLIIVIILCLGSLHLDITVNNVLNVIVLTSLFSVFLIASAVNENSKNLPLTIKKILCSYSMRSIADVSYGFYIYSWPIMNIMLYYMKGNNWGFWINHIIFLVGGFIITFSVSWCSYKFFEKPIINLKNKYAPYNNTT